MNRVRCPYCGDEFSDEYYQAYHVPCPEQVTDTKRKRMIEKATISATTIAEVRQRYDANLVNYPRFCTCLRETFAEFTNEPEYWHEALVRTPADAVACFPEFNPSTVADAWRRAVKTWAQAA